MANSKSHASFFSPPIFLLNVLVGITFFVINFPTLITNWLAPGIDNAFLRDLIVSVTRTVRDGIGAYFAQEPRFFEALMTYGFLGLQLYALLVVVMCVTRLRLRPLVFAILGFIVGLYAVHLIAYAVLAALWTAQLGMEIFSLIANAIAWFINLLFRDALAFVIATAFAIYLYVNRRNLLRAIVALLILAAVGMAVYYLVPPLFALILQIMLAIAEFLKHLLAPIIAFVLWLLGPLIAVIQWIVENIIAPVLAFLITAALFVGAILLAALIVLTAFASMGNVVTDQVRAALRVRRIGTKDHMLNGFALGSALALVLLTSVAAAGISSGVNTGWRQSLAIGDAVTGWDLENRLGAALDPVSIFVSTMPRTVHQFVTSHLTSQSPPLIDAIVLVALLALSCSNVALAIVGLSKPDEEDRPITFFPVEVLAILLWLVLSIASLFLQAATEG